MAPERVSVPPPDLVRPAVFEESITPARVTSLPLVLSKMPPAVVFLKRVDQSWPALVAVYCKVPPPKVMLPPTPSAEAWSTTKVPRVRVVVPV